MRRRAVPGILLLAALLAPAAGAGQSKAAGQPNGAAQPDGALRGRVSTETSPLGRATVYAYELAKLQVHKVTSSADGAFRFDQLPAGVYKLIAFKVGYEPAVVMLSRAATDALQFVDLRLVAERPDQQASGARSTARADSRAGRTDLAPRRSVSVRRDR